MGEALRHYEENKLISAPPKEVFEFVDDPLNLSRHMEKPKPEMLWGWMKNTPDEINLIVIGHYTMGFEITPQDDNSNLSVYIDYELPKSAKTRWLGYLFGGMYPKWCVRQMLSDNQKHFQSNI